MNRKVRLIVGALVLALVVPSGATNASSICGGGWVGGGVGNSAGECATVAAGRGNSAQGEYSSIAGGNGNTAEGDNSTIGGGRGNIINGDDGTIGGGRGNGISGEYGSIGGGNGNQVSGANATIPGGIGNLAWGENTFAAGTGAQAWYAGSFVWADRTKDSTGNYPSFSSTRANQFAVRATGGVIFVLAVDGKGKPTKWCEASAGDFRCTTDGVTTSFSQLVAQNTVLRQKLDALEERVAKLEQK